MSRILVVEDEPAIRELLVLVLGDEGHVVLTAADGRAALDLLRQQPIDLVLSDVMMPRLDGPGLVARLRAEPQGRAVPVILMSAVGPGDVSLDARTFFLAKPFELGHLLGLVHAALADGRDGDGRARTSDCPATRHAGGRPSDPGRR